MAKYNTRKLRRDLMDKYGTAMYSGFPMAVIDLSDVESMSDEEIVKALLTKACPITSTCGTLEGRWNSQYVLAKDILSGSFTGVEEWVRTKQPSDKYGEGKNQGVLAIFLEKMNIYVDPSFFAMIDRK